MWFNLLVCVIGFVRIGANIDENEKVLHKCCPKNEALKLVTDSDSFNDLIECVNIDSAKENFNITINPLIISPGVPVEYGIPRDCSDKEIAPVPSKILIIQSNNFFNRCYDRLEIIIEDGTLQTHIPEIVEISCDDDDLNPSLSINQLRKCCPTSQDYDSKLHVCRNSSNDKSEAWLVQHLTANNSSEYEVDHSLTCKSNEFAVELKEKYFKLQLNGSQLKVLKKDGGVTESFPSGQWCVDHEFTDQKLVARVCTRDCGKYGALCTKKCCPVGYHYQPRSCNTLLSKCVPNTDFLPFNVSEYTDPLEKDYPRITDTMGIGHSMHCHRERAVLNKSAEDRHWLNHDGRLYSRTSFDFNYCFESFDRRNCPNGDITIYAVNCFAEPSQYSALKFENFRISFVLLTISSVCLALTLLIYLWLPELHNLHGRTLICHVSMMLLAFCCLARAQYAYTPDTSCKLLGYSIYFSFVAAFAWLNVMCFDIWWTLGTVRTTELIHKTSAEMRRFIWYSIYAWSFAIIMTMLMFLFDHYPVADFLDADIGVDMCWFRSIRINDLPHYIYFVIPMGLISCTNFVLWVLTARHCARVKSEVHRLQAGSIDRAKRRFRIERAKYILAGKLWIVMGAGWISELLSTIATEPQWLWSVVDYINALQGVSIFIILVIKPKIYHLIRKRIGLGKSHA